VTIKKEWRYGDYLSGLGLYLFIGFSWYYW